MYKKNGFYMRYLFSVLLFVSVIIEQSHAAVSAHECNVAKVESGSGSIIVFVENCEVKSGPDSTMHQGNAYTNDTEESLVYLWLAQDSDEIKSKSHMLSLVLTAFVSEKKMIFRWEPIDSKFIISHVLIK